MLETSAPAVSPTCLRRSPSRSGIRTWLFLPGSTSRSYATGPSAVAAADRPAEPGFSFLGAGMLPPLRAGGRPGPRVPERVRHRLHAVPAGGEPGHARAHLRVPDLHLRAHRAWTWRTPRSTTAPRHWPRRLSWRCAPPGGTTIAVSAGVHPESAQVVWPPTRAARASACDGCRSNRRRARRGRKRRSSPPAEAGVRTSVRCSCSNRTTSGVVEDLGPLAAGGPRRAERSWWCRSNPATLGVLEVARRAGSRHRGGRRPGLRLPALLRRTIGGFPRLPRRTRAPDPGHDW